MVVRIVSIEDDTTLGERSPRSGRYRVVLEADGMPEEFQFKVEFPSGGGRSISWEPAKSFLSDVEKVPVMVVASITDTVVRFHQGESVALPAVVEPQPIGPDTVLIRL